VCCSVNRGVTGMSVGCAVDSSVTGLGDGCIAGSELAGTGKGNVKDAVGPYVAGRSDGL